MPRYYVLDSEGKFQRVEFPGEIKGKPIDINQVLFDTLGNSISTFMSSAFVSKAGITVNLCRAEGFTFASGTLARVKLNTNYRTEKDVVVPDWGKPESPVFAIDWIPPVDMQVRFAVQLNDKNAIDGVFMVIFDAKDPVKTYKIPLPNVYTDGTICLPVGFIKQHTTVQAAFDYALDMIEQSPWNDHLMRENKELAKAGELFKFKANGAGFETLPPAKPWREVCNKVGNASLEYIKP